MKTLLLSLILATAAQAQLAKIAIVVTLPDGVTTVRTTLADKAANNNQVTALLESFAQYRQAEKVPVLDANGNPTVDAQGAAVLAPKYTDLAEFIALNSLDLFRAILRQFPPGALSTEIAQLAARQAALDAKMASLIAFK